MMNFKIVAGEKETAEKLLDNIKSFIRSEMNQTSININEARSNKYIVTSVTEYETLRDVLEYLNQISVEE